MKKWMVVVLMAVGSVVALAQGESPQLRAEMQKLYRTFEGFVAKNDIQGTLALLHPNFVGVDTKGNRMTYADMKAMCESMKDIAKDGKAKITVVHVGGDDREATVWLSMVMEWSQKSGNSWKRMKLTTRYAETWLRTGSGWKCTYSQQLPTDEPWPF